MYSDFKIPFWCQSRTETISDSVGGYKKLKILKDVGLHHMSFGMEHGNEKFRREVIDRPYTNESAIAALKKPVKLGIPFTINNIIGFPDETYELAMDTVEINRQIESFSLSCSTLSPFKGTKLRTLAEDKGYVGSEQISPPNTAWSILTMPQFPKEQIYGLQRTFVMYVKFPKSRWPELKKAEVLTPLRDGGIFSNDIWISKITEDCVWAGGIESFVTIQNFCGRKIRFHFINLEELVLKVRDLGFHLIYKPRYIEKFFVNHTTLPIEEF